MISRLIHAVCLWCLLGSATAAPSNRVFDGKCGAPIKSSEDAMAKADFIIEGIVTVFIPNEQTLPIQIFLDEAKVIREREPSNKNRKTLNIIPGPCFAQGLQSFLVKGSGSVEGKRMRFFGNEHEFSPKQRFFYMQPAGLPLPVAAKAGPPWDTENVVSKGHADNVSNTIGDGWHRGTSTEGKFSVDLPGPYADMTGVQDGVPNYILRATDAAGSTFIVVFAPSRKYSRIAGTFDNEMRQAQAEKSVFRGMPALRFREVTDKASGAVMSSLWVRVPGGTYAFAVRTSKENEAQSLKARERFFNSIVFE